MAQFYNPYQKRTQSAGSPSIAPTQPGGSPSLVPTQPASPATGPNKTGGSIYDPGSYGHSGSTLYHLLSDKGWNTGETFQANSKIAALEAMKNAQSGANPEDYAAMDEMRNYYRSALADLPGNTEAGISSFDTQSQRGLNNLLSQYKNVNAGRGTLGSRQYAGAAGDIVGRANQDYINGLIAARSDAITQAGKIGSGLSGVQNQDLAERTFQGDQAAQYASLISNFMAQDQGREGQLLQMQGQKDAANKAMWGQIIQGLAVAGGTALAGPAGGMAAGAATKGATG